MIVDGEGMILGRLSSIVAELLLKGESIVLVNAEKVVISGNKEDIMSTYFTKRGRKDVANPRKGPMFPRTPDGILHRTVRGMINYRTERGRKALKNLRVYIGVPDQYSKSKLVKIEGADSQKLHGKVTTIGKVSQELGYKW
jgi:large subunit ribosomal protein L13